MTQYKPYRPEDERRTREGDQDTVQRGDGEMEGDEDRIEKRQGNPVLEFVITVFFITGKIVTVVFLLTLWALEQVSSLSYLMVVGRMTHYRPEQLRREVRGSPVQQRQGWRSNRGPHFGQSGQNNPSFPFYWRSVFSRGPLLRRQPSTNRIARKNLLLGQDHESRESRARAVERYKARRRREGQ